MQKKQFENWLKISTSKTDLIIIVKYGGVIEGHKSTKRTSLHSAGAQTTQLSVAPSNDSVHYTALG